MRTGDLIFLGSWLVLTVVFLCRVAYQLVLGKLVARRGERAPTRRENAKSYWRGVVLDLVMAAAMVALLIQAAGGLLNWRTPWH